MALLVYCELFSSLIDLQREPTDSMDWQWVPLAWMVEQRGPLIRFTLVQAMVLFRCPILTIQPPMVP